MREYDIKNDDIYRFLRCLFRYSKLKELGAPNILFENEERMIKERLQKLSVDEVFTAVIAWDSFYKEQCIDDEIQNDKLNKDLELYFHTLN